MASYTPNEPTRAMAGKASARRRSPGEGSVYPAKDGRYRGMVTWTDPDGTQRRRYVSGSTQVETRTKLDKLRAELRLGTLAPVGPQATVGEYLAQWILRDRLRVRPSTWKARETYVRCYLIPALGRMSLVRLSAPDVERALAWFIKNGRPVTPDDRKRGRQRHRPISPMTARHCRATLRIALADAVRNGLVGRNAAADARPPYVSDRPVVYLDVADVLTLIEATKDDRHGSLYALAAMTGLRQGELLGLAWSDVRNGNLTVRQSLALDDDHGFKLGQPKSARSRRTLPLPALAVEVLERQREWHAVQRAAAGSAWQGDRDNLVFTNAIGEYLSPHVVSNAFRKAIMATDVPRVRFHDLRHSCATMLLAQGVPLAVISEWLGHSGIAITMKHYAAVVPELRQNAADAMDRALRGGAS